MDMIAVLMIALTVPLFACADGGRAAVDRPVQEPVTQSSQVPATLIVSGAQTHDTLRIERSAAAEADVVLLTVVDVVNPDRRGIDIEVAIQGPDSAIQRVPLGSIALFPVDQGGTFSLRLPPAALHLLRTGDGPVNLLVTLAPDPEAGLTDRRSLRITEVRWSRTAARRSVVR
jgi:hypothetical protein